MQPRRILFCALESKTETGSVLREMMERPARVQLEFLEVEASAAASQKNSWPERARRFQPDLVVLLASLKALRAWQRPSHSELARKTPVVAITEEVAEPETIMAALENGISDFVLPPLRAADVLPRLWRLLESQLVEDPSVLELKQRLGLQQFIGQCPVFLARSEKDSAARRLRRERVDLRRDRHGQGSLCARHSLPESSRCRGIRADQLRRDSDGFVAE